MAARKVVLINHLLEPPDQISGITRYLFALLEQLVQSRDYRYVLATTWSASRLPEALRASSIEVRTLPFHAKTPVNIASQCVTIPRLMRESAAALEFNCNPIGCLVGRWPRVNVVHDIYMDVMPACYPLRHRLWWKLLFPLSLRTASNVICVSQNTRRDVETRYPFARDKLVVIHEAGIVKSDETGSAQSVRFEAPYGLFVGNVSPNKNPDVLVHALKILRERGDAPKIYHVGRDAAGLLADAERRISPDHPIRKAGALSDAALVAAYRGATCFINTSLNEGFCLPVVEAQSLGVPVICTDIPVLREVAGEGALFFAPRDAQALSHHLRSVFSDAALRERMAAASLKNAARFSWRDAALRTERVFDVSIARNPQRLSVGLAKGRDVL